jgi:DNA-binding NarL/FixJ family response regulator
MSALTRSAHGLSTPVDDWWSRGMCRHEDPELWFTDSVRAEAMHVCRVHCPVVEVCYRDALKARPRAGVQGGEAWSAKGAPLYGGAIEPAKTCVRCRPDQPAPRPRPPVPRDVPPLGLSHAEWRVAKLLPSDLSIAEIAEVLGLSPNTVKSHISVIYRAAGVQGRSAFRTSALSRAASCDR